MLARFVVGVLLLLLGVRTLCANPLEGYANHAEFQKRVELLAKQPRVRVTSLGKTRAERDIVLITLGGGETEQKPATLIVGDVTPGEVVGGEIVLRMIEDLLTRAEKDEELARLLEQRTLYFLPRPAPDAAEKCFAQPYREPSGNATPTDDDRDFATGEDPPEDLNEDGWITQMRIEDVAGEYIAHPDEPRVLIRADATRQERGKYRLLTEGRDNDGDEQWNEDASDGVSFNRNFTFQYPAFKAHAGPHAVSEAETRAIADFCFEHPNIACVLTITPEDNLLHPWKPDGNKDKAKIRTTILSEDAKHQDVLAKKYQKLREAKGAPGSPDGEGSFTKWAYFHYGRWSWGARAWWIPPTEAKKKEGEEDGKEEKMSDEKRGADDVNALRYFADKEINGFVDWQEVKHPDFPDQKVEVGGFKPFYRTHPPIAEVADLATRQVDFLLETVKLQPRLALAKVKAQSLGGGVVRLTATVVNEGFLPTHAEMGVVAQQVYPLQIAWTVPEKTVWIQGAARTRLGRLAGEGGQAEKTWLVRLPEPLPKELTVRVSAPAVGSAEAKVTLEVKPDAK